MAARCSSQILNDLCLLLASLVRFGWPRCFSSYLLPKLLFGSTSLVSSSSSHPLGTTAEIAVELIDGRALALQHHLSRFLGWRGNHLPDFQIIMENPIVKYETDLDEKTHIRLLQMPLETTQPTCLTVPDKSFKMEPQTSLPDLHLLPLSPMQTTSDSQASGSFFGSDLDLSSLTAAPILETSRNSKSGEEDEFDDRLNGKRRRRPSRSRRRSSGSAPANKTRFRRHISPEELQAQRNQANIRERMRTQSLNEAFANLRQHIPTMPSDKMSKIQTLKLASDYIGFLYTVLKEGEVDPGHRGGGGQQQPYPDQSGGGDTNLSVCFGMWRMQDVWNNTRDVERQPNSELS